MTTIIIINTAAVEDKNRQRFDIQVSGNRAYTMIVL